MLNEVRLRARARDQRVILSLRRARCNKRSRCRSDRAVQRRGIACVSCRHTTACFGQHTLITQRAKRRDQSRPRQAHVRVLVVSRLPAPTREIGLQDAQAVSAHRCFTFASARKACDRAERGGGVHDHDWVGVGGHDIDQFEILRQRRRIAASEGPIIEHHAELVGVFELREVAHDALEVGLRVEHAEKAALARIQQIAIAGASKRDGARR